MEKLSNILLVAITRMGDMLQASPMISGLKKEHPEARITVAIEKQFATICEGIPGIDEVYVIDLGVVHRALCRDVQGVVDAFKYVEQVVSDLQSKKFELCINMSSSAYTAVLLRLLDVQDSRGWVSDEEGNRLISNPWSMLFAAFVYHSNRDFNAINIVDIFRCCAGVSSHPQKLMYEPSENDKAFAERFLGENGISQGGPLVAIQVGASQEKRQWSPAYFARVVQYLVEGIGARVIFTGAPSEVAIIEAVFAHYRHPNVVSAAARTNLGQLSGLLEMADVLVTGDTGPMHLAVAVGTPVVALFLASALCYETGPYGYGNIIIEPQVSCYACNPNAPCKRPDCHEQITPELVAHLVKERLHSKELKLDTINIPDDLAPAQTVGVYVTEFDEDKFLKFRRVNKSAPRKGAPYEFYHAAREAYMALWKEEFNIVAKPAVWQRIEESATNNDVSYEHILPGLKLLSELSFEGIKQIGNLLLLIDDIRSAPSMLGEANQKIEAVDRAIEECGLVNCVLGALSRMFIMEKQNLRGNDAKIIAMDTRQLYVRLDRRARKFGALFDYYYQLCSEAENKC